MTTDTLAYITAVKSAVNSSYEEKKTLKEFVCEDLKAKGKGHPWLWFLFALCFLGTATFYAELFFDISALQEPPAYFCLPKELKNTNWTIDQIQEVSRYSNSTQSCMALKLNYKEISKMSYGDAIDFVNNLDEIDGGMCNEVGGEIHVLSGGDETYAEDFNLLCEGFDANIYAGFYKGCIYGGAVFGILGDRFGRKTSINIAILPFILSAFVPAYFQTATVYMWSRFIVGFCGFGIVNLLFVLLVENSQRKLREIFAILINLTVSFGMLWQYTIAYGVNEKIKANQILLAISTSVFVLFVSYLVESPKHLICKKQYSKAYKQLKNKEPAVNEFISQDEPSTSSEECSVSKFIQNQAIVKFFCSKNYWNLTWLCIAIYSFWFFAFNFCDMKVEAQDFSRHIKILTIYDSIGYIVTAFLVYFLPRRVLHISMATIFGLMLVLGASLPSEELPFYQALLTICRSFGNPAIGLFCLHIAEIFPTEIRSTAIGVIGSIGYFVGYQASSLVGVIEDSIQANSLPKFTTILGIASVLLGFLIYLLPETKKEDLKDYVSQKYTNESEDHENEKNVKEISMSSILFFVITVLCFTVLLTNINLGN